MKKTTDSANMAIAFYSNRLLSIFAALIATAGFAGDPSPFRLDTMDGPRLTASAAVWYTVYVSMIGRRVCRLMSER